ncbi:MAG: hypothetical protein ACLQDI_13900, partial [Syntrophobacteraceae bacterium]
ARPHAGRTLGTNMTKNIRRVVTGHDAAGRSIFVIDAPTPHVFSRTRGSAIVHELWETTGTPADNRGNADAIARGHRLPPPRNGSVFRVIEYPPDSERLAAIAREHALPDDSGRAAALFPFFWAKKQRCTDFLDHLNFLFHKGLI